jgi:hypothetical protein
MRFAEGWYLGALYASSLRFVAGVTIVEILVIDRSRLPVCCCKRGAE